MTKKVLCILLAIATLVNLFGVVGFAENVIIDPLNNELFSVVKEMPELKDARIGTFEDGYAFVCKEEGKNVSFIDREGNIVNEIAGRDSSDSMGKFIEPRERDPKFDSRYGNVIPFIDGFTYKGGEYKDINGKVIIDQSFQDLGSYNGGWYLHASKLGTFMLNFATGDTYDTNATIKKFDDDGYTIMKVLEGNTYTGCYIIRLKKGAIPTVRLNGKKILFDQIPVIKDGRTLVPLRAIFEKLGATIDWKADTQTITATKDGTTISLSVGNATATKNGQEIKLDVPAEVINGRTLVPVRFVADCFGVAVDWDETYQIVKLTNK